MCLGSKLFWLGAEKEEFVRARCGRFRIGLRSRREKEKKKGNSKKEL